MQDEPPRTEESGDASPEDMTWEAEISQVGKRVKDMRAAGTITDKGTSFSARGCGEKEGAAWRRSPAALQAKELYAKKKKQSSREAGVPEAHGKG